MKIKDIEQLKKIIELSKNKKLKGIKELREFSDFIAELVNKEYLDTMKVIKKEFKVLDDMVIDIVNNDELKPGEKGDKILDNFKNASEKMLQIRVSELIENSKPAITDKMATLTHNSGLNPIKGLALLDPMFELVTLAFDTYIETCIEYVGNRLGDLLEATETELKVDLLKKLISSDPEKKEELISLLKRLRDLVKEMD